MYGAGWLVTPDGEFCLHVATGTTLPAISYQPDQFGLGPLAERAEALEAAAQLALQGVAINLALPGAILPADQRFALGINWGEFEGFHAIGVNGALAIGDAAALTAGAGMGISTRSFAFRGGLQLGF